MNSISFNICSICIKIIWQDQQFAFQFFKSFPCLKKFNLGVTVVFITLFLYFVFHDHRFALCQLIYNVVVLENLISGKNKDCFVDKITTIDSFDCSFKRFFVS